MNSTQAPPPESAPAVSDAAEWQAAARLREEFRGWVVIWLAPEGEFRAYRRLPGTRRDTALAAATSDEMSAAIRQAEQAHALRRAGSREGQT